MGAMSQLDARRITEGLGTRVVGVRLVRQAPPPVGSSLSGTGEDACATVPAVEVHEEIDSTNLEALRQAEAGAGEGLVVVAETQTAGRGRLGHTWLDVPGGCLLFSVLLRPPRGAEGLLTAAAALSVAEAVRAELELPAEIKWPNDLMLGGRKFGGVLAESAGGELATVGVGINVIGHPADLPEELRETATFLVTPSAVRPACLRSSARGGGRELALGWRGRPRPLRQQSPRPALSSWAELRPSRLRRERLRAAPPHGIRPLRISSSAGLFSDRLRGPRSDVRLALLRAVLRRLDENYLRLCEGDASQIVKRAEELDCTVGREVCVIAGSESICGEAMGWGRTGTLLLRDTAGRVREFEAGEVTLC